MAIHERLREMRERTGMTQKAFAQSLHMEQSKYNKWENGKNAPDYEALCQLADSLEVTTDYLLGRTDTPKADQVDIVETTGLTADAVELLSRMQNDPDRGKRYLRVINFLIENEPSTHLWEDLYHYLFSSFLFGNPHQSPEAMENDKRFTSNSFVVAFSDEVNGQRLDIQGEHLNNMFFVNIQEDVMKLRQQALDLKGDEVFRILSKSEEESHAEKEGQP